MSNIIAPSDSRAAYITGLRALADWLDANPDAPAPISPFNVPMTVNAEAEAFAEANGLPLQHDDEGNAFCNVDFGGSVVYHVYGYVDFTVNADRIDERTARKWADGRGLEIVAAGGAR